MISRKDQAETLRTLAQKQGVAQRGNALNSQGMMIHRRNPWRVVSQMLKTLAVMIMVAAIAAGAYFFLETNKKDKAVINELQEQSRTLKQNVATLSDKAQAIESTVIKSAKENEALTAQLQELSNRNKSLQENLTRIVDDKAGLEKTLETTTKKVQDLESAKKALHDKTELELKAFEAQIKELKSTMLKTQVPQIATPVNNQTASLGSVEGRIVLVNKKMRFVVINLGKNQGIAERMQLTVFRNGSAISKISVIEARPEVSACETEDTNIDFYMGDIVRLK